MEELRLDYFSFEDITIAKRLEALVYFSSTSTSNLKKMNIRRPNLVYLNFDKSKLLDQLNIDSPRWMMVRSESLFELEILQLKCPKIIDLTVVRNKN